jgi:hypothetical protein
MESAPLDKVSYGYSFKTFEKAMQQVCQCAHSRVMHGYSLMKTEPIASEETRSAQGLIVLTERLLQKNS